MKHSSRKILLGVFALFYFIVIPLLFCLMKEWEMIGVWYGMFLVSYFGEILTNKVGRDGNDKTTI
jgi:Na+-driven multidrug efflux pump